jgi:hypothetical protein
VDLVGRLRELEDLLERAAGGSGGLVVVTGPVPADARHALWVASRGLPGVARSLAATLAGVEGDPLTHLALHAPSGAEFLDLDVDLVRLLEAAAGRASGLGGRARLASRKRSGLITAGGMTPRMTAACSLGGAGADSTPRWRGRVPR